MKTFEVSDELGLSEFVAALRAAAGSVERSSVLALDVVCVGGSYRGEKSRLRFFSEGLGVVGLPKRICNAGLPVLGGIECP